MNSEYLKQYILLFSFIKNKVKYAYSGYELNYNKDKDIITGTVNFKLGLSESEVIHFESKVNNTNNSLSFNTKYYTVNYKGKKVFDKESTSCTKLPTYSEVDTFLIITKDKLLSSKYLVHIIDNKPNLVFKVSKKFKFDDIIKNNPIYFEDKLIDINYDEIHNYINKKITLK